MVDLLAVALDDPQAKHVLLVLLNDQRVRVWGLPPLKTRLQPLIELLLQLINLLLGRLDFLPFFLARLQRPVIQPIHELLLELVLLMRDLILACLTIDKWFIHSILVV